MNHTFHQWTPTVNYDLGDVATVVTIKFLKRKTSRFNRKKLQAITTKTYYKAIR